MKNKLKRFLAFAITFAMVFSLIPGNSLVSRAEGNTGSFDFNHLGSDEDAISVTDNVLSFKFNDGVEHDATLSITKGGEVVTISDNSNDDQKHFETPALTSGDKIVFTISYDEGTFPGLDINGTPYAGETAEVDGKKVTTIPYTCDSFPNGVLSPGVVSTGDPTDPPEPTDPAVNNGDVLFTIDNNQNGTVWYATTNDENTEWIEVGNNSVASASDLTDVTKIYVKYEANEGQSLDDYFDETDQMSANRYYVNGTPTASLFVDSNIDSFDYSAENQYQVQIRFAGGNGGEDPSPQASGPISYHVTGDTNADKISNPVCTIDGKTEDLSSVWPEAGVVTFSLQVAEGYEIVPSTLDIHWEYDDLDNPDQPGGVRLNLSSELQTAIVEGLVSPEGYTFSSELDVFNLENALISLDQNPRMRIEFSVNKKFDDTVTLHFYTQEAEGYAEDGSTVVYRNIQAATSAEDMHLESFTFNGNALVINEGIANAGGYIGVDATNELTFLEGFGTKIDAVYVSTGDVDGSIGTNSVPDNMDLVSPTETDEYGADHYKFDVPGVEYSILVVYGLSDNVNLKWSYLEQDKKEDFFVENGTVEVTKVVRDKVEIYPYPDGQEPQCTVQVDEFGGEVFVKRGDTVTLKLIPNAGYQLKSASLNGSELTADEKNVSTFEVTVNGNLHFAGAFVKAEDSVEVNSESLQGAQINPDAAMSVINSGTLGLTINDNDLYLNKDAALGKAGEGAEAVAFVDMGLENLVSKGVNDADGSKIDNYWVETLTDLSNPIVVEVDLGPDSDLGLAENETITVVREHAYEDGTLIENIGGDTWVNEETGHRIVAITTDKFSTYTIAKVEGQQSGDGLNDYEFLVEYDMAFDASVSCVLKEDGKEDLECGSESGALYNFGSEDGGFKTIELTLKKPSEYQSNGEYTEKDNVSVVVNGEDNIGELRTDSETGTLTWTYIPETSEPLHIWVYWTQEEKEFASVDMSPESFMIWCNPAYNGTMELLTDPAASAYREVWKSTKALYPVGTKSVAFKLIPDEGEDLQGINIQIGDGERIFVAKEEAKELTPNEDGLSYTYTLDTSSIPEFTWISLEFVFTNRSNNWLKDCEFYVSYDGSFDANVFCELADDDGKYVSCGLNTNGSFKSDDGDGYKTIRLTLTKPADYYGDGEDKEQDQISIMVNGEDQTSLLDEDTLTWTYKPESEDGLLIGVYWTQEGKDYETFDFDPEKEDFIVECWTDGCGQVKLETTPVTSVYRKAWNATRASYLVGTKEVTIKIIPDEGEDIDSVLFCGEEIPVEDLTEKQDEEGKTYYTYTWDTTGCEADSWYDFGFVFTCSEPEEPDVWVEINGTPEKFTAIGDTTNLTTTIYSNGIETEGEVVWSSSDDSIAAVDETGKVTAVANGVATITATLKDNKDICASVAVEVSAAVDTAKDEESGYGSDPGTISAETNIAQDVAESITIEDFDTTTTKAEMDTQDSHLVNNRGGDAKLALYVEKLDAAPLDEVEKIESVKGELPVSEEEINEISTLDISMFKTIAGEAERLTEIKKPITVKITIPVDAILDAASEGITRHYFLITVHEGEASISDDLDFDAVTGTVSINVDKFSTRILGYYDTVDVTSVTITGDTSTLTEVGETTQLSVTVEPEEATIQEVSWTSSNPKVATVDETGKVKAVASGTTTITATSKDRDENVSAEVTIKVSIPVASVEINKTEATLTKAAETLKLTATVLPKEAENKEVTWTSSNPKVATVDAAGKVTAIANGTTTITVASKANAELKKECKVTVNIPKAEETPNVTVSYHTHIQTLGDSQGTKTNGQMAGTSGMAKRLENIWVKVEGNKNLGIQYTTHCQTYGWLPWSANGEANGTSGEAKRLEAIKIQLTGADADKYDVYYRVHAQSYGWLAWVKNGEPSGTAGYAKRLEGIQIVVVKKGAQAPGLDYADVKASAGTHNNSGYISKTTGTIVIPGSASTPNVMYKTHVQTFGWQNWKLNGQMSGTSGQAKRLEGINIKLTNSDYAGGIRYSTHVQSYGWQDWKSNGEMSGTSGEAKRLEAIKIELTGEMAKHYDVYYRVHAQSYGWLGWAKNGESAGTEGLAKRLEGIQIVLVPKGAAAPSATYGDIKSVQTSAFIKK